MQPLKNTTAECPACGSRALVEGRILADGSEDGHAERFFPAGIRLLSLTRSIRLTGRQKFKACTNCGHLWNTVDATGLRELIELKGSPELKEKISTRKRIG